MTGGACPLCNRATFAPVLRVEGVPVDEGRLATTAREAAAALSGPVELSHCATCGMVYDTAARVENVVYEPGYDTFLGHSPSIAGRLVEHHGLRGGTAVDIACGRGDFMLSLLKRGMAAGVGIDPAAHDSPDPRIRMVRRPFAPALLPADAALVSCRHMLYLLDDPVGFLRGLGAALAGSDTPIYLELMNEDAMLRASDPWDVTYEHRSYFTVESATHLLEASGFAPLRVEPVFRDRFLAVEARPRDGGADDSAIDGWASSLTPAVAGLQERAGRRVDEWRDALTAVRAAHGRVVAWCGGARAISFMAVSQAGEEVAAVVDVSPTRQGRFLPVSARPIVAPDAVPEFAPDAILVTNPVYTDEVRDALSAMNLGTIPVLELDDPSAPSALTAALAGASDSRRMR
jgi:C-methyltransferase C-terminal domain/Methyltransferase domain